VENMCVCLLLSTFDKAVRVGTREEPGTLTQGGAVFSLPFFLTPAFHTIPLANAFNSA
jgi:hypothetical protein